MRRRGLILAIEDKSKDESELVYMPDDVDAIAVSPDISIPGWNNLILLDKLYILSYVFVVLTMAVIVKNSWVDATGDVRAATRADRRGLVLLTGGYVASAALILIVNLA